jgi:alkylation response protein AidB-like acyl-CoA dehydrogenase
MNFELSEEHQDLRSAIESFASREVSPELIRHCEETRTPPLEAFRKLAKLGWLELGLPQGAGGVGDYVGFAVVLETLSRAYVPLADLTYRCAVHGGSTIGSFGTGKMKAELLPKIAAGEVFCVNGITEPGTGADAASVQTRAVLDGDSWVINGSKTFTTNGQVADVCVVMAVTDRSASSHGISAFLVEKGTPGFRPGKKENKLGMRCSPTNEMILTDCRVPASQLCGKQGEGFVDALRILDGGRISIAALAVGIAQGAYEASLRYSKQRKQFGRFISEFQAIQHKLADMATDIDASRLLTLRAAWMKDSGQNVNKESSMAKLFASETAVRVADEAVQVHGGYGFLKDYPVVKFYRDVKLCTIGEGSSEIQRLVIARQLLNTERQHG